ncbi:hypothetical protein BN381_100126 [Candidatus Microthrix parvicella RN1]|uniref:Uncharacterized protein n=1 Tax=Candidatus Neomicrothrix parvicella RN1 TaxID=1229780 RepID=R4YVZ8_9ACTN|nr:hypothetical protein BN381_100126 [Candidatus Microthrix parvicella RN1]
MDPKAGCEPQGSPAGDSLKLDAVGEGRFELPASTSRTWRANQAALLPGVGPHANAGSADHDNAFGLGLGFHGFRGASGSGREGQLGWQRRVTGQSANLR